MTGETPALRIHAPDFTTATAWLNAAQPISVRDLRGQVVILDFWTHCCINCLHVLPVLRDLEERHAHDPLVVIGVHSAKFDAENDARHIRAAMERHGVSHPVAMDADQSIWSAYAVRSWPTLVFLRPDGTVAAVAPGEPDPAELERFVQRLLAEGRAAGTLAAAPLHLTPPRALETGPLSFPGSVLAAGERIFVSDTGHHRVLALDAAGRYLDSIGAGLRGARGGAFAEAALDEPQGLALDGNLLYVADARAHAVFRADLAARTVTLVAGTGALGTAPLGFEAVPAAQTALRSPWGLALRGQTLFIALAGSHQLAALDLVAGTIRAVAGNGREALIDGPGAEAALAQPSGLSLDPDGDRVWFADSECSGVRFFDAASGVVGSIAGGPGLFDFGDGLGPARSGVLQHPLAVLAGRGEVLVADTYNDKLKRLVASASGPLLAQSAGDREAGANVLVEPVYGGPGAPLPLGQPGGLCSLPSGALLVADTNQHRLLVVEAGAARVLALQGVPQPQQGVAAAPVDPLQGSAPASAAGWFTALIEAPPGTGLAPGAGELRFEIVPPEGFALAEGAPWSASLEVSRRSDLLGLAVEKLQGTAQGGPSLPLLVAVRCTHDRDVDSELLVRLRTVACDARDHAACYPITNLFRVPLRLLRAGQASVRCALPLELSR
jgi:thiol-disulfide isomerase/thioredoxin